MVLLILNSGCWNNNETQDKDGITQSNKTFVVAQSGSPISLDPANINDTVSMYVTNQIYESLLSYKPDSTEVQPALALDWEDTKDGLIWTFDLRRGVKFQDGTDFNAQAVKYNFDRWRLQNHPRHKGSFEYYNSMFNGFPGNIKDIQVEDPYKIKFILNKPQAPFLSNLAMTSFAISSPTAVAKYGDEYYKHPVGTGPFKLLKWNKNKEIILGRNDNYWGDKAKIKRVVFKVIQSNSMSLRELQKGKIDAIIDLNPDEVKLINKDTNLQVILRPSMNIGYLAINNEKAPFNNIKVRQALNYAVNKKALINKYYGGLAKIAKSPLPPFLWGYNDEIQNYDYNPAKAKALLAEAGLPHGFKTTLWTMSLARPYIPWPLEIADSIKADLAKVGIQADISVYDWQTYVKKGKAGEHNLYLIGWIGDNGDPDNFLYMLFDKNNTVKGSATNFAFYKNDKVHDLLIRAREESDQNVRADLYMQAQGIIMDDAPIVPLVHTTPPVVARKSVRNWLPHATGSEAFNYIEIR